MQELAVLVDVGLFVGGVFDLAVFLDAVCLGLRGGGGAVDKLEDKGASRDNSGSTRQAVLEISIVSSERET